MFRPNLTKPIYYKNRQWAVTGYGIECLTQQYEIRKDRLLEQYDPGFYSWPVHMCEKSWVNRDEFIPAFCAALKYHVASKADLAKVVCAIDAINEHERDAARYAHIAHCVFGERAWLASYSFYEVDLVHSIMYPDANSVFL